MKQAVFTGASVAIVTPFTEEGKINFEKFHELVDMQIAGGTAAITVCGTTGESATLSMEEHVALVRDCVRYVAGRAKVIAGAGSNNTAHALELCLACQEAGADALLVVTPYYNKTTQAGLVAHYTYLADRVSTPIIVYSVPSRTGMSPTPETMRILSAHPMINGLKDANGDLDFTARVIALCGEDLNVWSGNDDITADMMTLGAKGVISVWSNVDPRSVADLAALCLKGGFAEARKMQEESMELINALFIETNPIPVKEAMNMMGLGVGAYRLPLVPMQDGNREILRRALASAGLL